MKERPILYSTPMAIAKRQGRKTQTRRIVKGTALTFLNDGFTPEYVAMPENGFCPYGQTGDILWGRETFAGDDLCGYVFRADHPDADLRGGDLDDGEVQIRKWMPSIFMPKVAAQIWERVVAVRIERLQDITEADAIAEGIDPLLASGAQLATHGLLYRHYTEHREGIFGTGLRPIKSYATLWESINGPGSWEESPWVWVITTEILSTNGRPKNL